MPKDPDVRISDMLAIPLAALSFRFSRSLLGRSTTEPQAPCLTSVVPMTSCPTPLRRIAPTSMQQRRMRSSVMGTKWRLGSS